ncbi:MAG: AhpC/TSA family protein [Alphaproteobacteria bacterium]|nr:AhpC/TSA family protein [Alphaproteobacteria bacterium]
MSDPSKQDPAYDAARALKAPLAEQLASFAKAFSDRAPLVGAAYQSLIEKLTRAGTGAEAPQEGDRLPPFLLPDIEGRLVSSEELLAKGPLVISFNRGNWCPFCWLELAALGDIAEDIIAQGATIVSITPETATYNREMRDRLGLAFPFLTDLDNSYGLELGIAMPISAEIRELVEPRGIDLTAFQKNDAWFVPLPAIFIVDRNAKIRKAYVNPDYRERFDPSPIPEILAALD